MYGFWKWFPKRFVTLSFFTQESRIYKKPRGFFQTGSANFFTQVALKPSKLFFQYINFSVKVLKNSLLRSYVFRKPSSKLTLV